MLIHKGYFSVKTDVNVGGSKALWFALFIDLDKKKNRQYCTVFYYYNYDKNIFPDFNNFGLKIGWVGCAFSAKFYTQKNANYG